MSDVPHLLHLISSDFRRASTTRACEGAGTTSSASEVNPRPSHCTQVRGESNEISGRFFQGKLIAIDIKDQSLKCAATKH